MQVLKIATHLDHIIHPFTISKGTDLPPTWKRVAGIALFLFASLASLGAAALFYLYYAAKKHREISQKMPLSIIVRDPSGDLSSLKLMEQFWKEHVQTFKIKHGTSSIYLQHFKKHGISHHYPPQLSDLVKKVRDIWTEHEKSVIEKSGYFRMFEQRYDNAHEKEEIAVSFSANPSITSEFTKGERGGGGEWIRELRRFVRYSEQNSKVFSEDQKKTLVKVKTFMHLMRVLPPMAIAINGGVAMRNPFWRAHGHGSFGSLKDFQEYVQNRFPDWKEPKKLSEFLNNVLGKEIEEVKERVSKQYEISVHEPVKAENLEFHILDEAISKRKKEQKDFPKLAFDQPRKLSNEEVARLKITYTGFSILEEYSDSKFEFDFAGDKTVVTRRALTEQTRKERAAWHAEFLFEQHSLEQWAKEFECEALMKQYGISLSQT